MAAMASSAAIPSLWPRGFNRQSEGPILGSGEHRYECVHDWIVAPTGLAFGDTHGLAQDKSGRIYVAHTVGALSEQQQSVCVYSAEGKFITAWGERYAGGAHGLDMCEENGREFLYHCDTRRRCVEKTDLEGNLLWSATCPMESGVYADANEWCPTNVAFAPGGELFVGDGYGKSFIHRFTADGQWKAVISKPGSSDGETSCPHGMGVDPRGDSPLLVVADRGNRRIQVMDLQGKHVANYREGVRMPCDMKFKNGLMLVPDLESVVTVYDEKFRPVVSLGDGHPTNLRGAPREQFTAGKFVHPHDAIWLASGDILVAEWVPIGRVTLLRHV